MDKEKIGKRIAKGSKWLLIVLWIIVLILAIMVVIKYKTLSIENINKTAIEVFREGYYGSAIELDDDKVLISVEILKNDKTIAVEKAKEYIYKLSKYKNRKYKDLVLIIGHKTTAQEKNILLTADIELTKIKSIDWNKLTRYEDVIRELNMKLQ